MIATIAWRELKTLFLSPLAWVVLAVITFLMAWLFLVQVDAFLLLQPRLAALPGAPGVTDLVVAPLFSSATILLMLIVPLMSMRLVAEEKRNSTWTLLLSAPVSVRTIVLGKFFGLLGFLLILLGLLFLMPLSLLLGTGLDMGKFASGALGLILLVAAFGAAGLFMSTLTRQPVIAATASFGLFLLLWLIDLAARNAGTAGGLFEYLSLLRHFQVLARGMVNSSDIIYYLLFIAVFLSLSVRKLDTERLQG
ncbi:MAG TPA: ABC transporter permease subunit [Gammaproteobacteria bacterium]|nr:ABC transporter permease subunit [Gammaproteobacteria bacterium]